MQNKLTLIIRSLLFYIGHYALIVAFSLIGLLLRPLPLTTRLKFMRIGVKLCLLWLHLSCNIKHKVHNLECITPDQASIVLSRHESTWETLAFHTIFPLQVNVVKKELKNIPFFGFILVTLNAILIDRTHKLTAIKQIKKEAAQAIKRGFWIVIFPGGTRIRPGELTQVQSGGAILAKQENVPVYLVTHNAGKTWSKGTFIKYPGTIDVYIKRLENSEQKSIETINSEAQAWFQSQYQ